MSRYRVSVILEFDVLDDMRARELVSPRVLKNLASDIAASVYTTGKSEARLHRVNEKEPLRLLDRYPLAPNKVVEDSTAPPTPHPPSAEEA